MTETELRAIARRAAIARLGMDAYATATEEAAASERRCDMWREADAVRRLIGDVGRLVSEVRRLRKKVGAA